MIESFTCRDTAALWQGKRCRRSRRTFNPARCKSSSCCTVPRGSRFRWTGTHAAGVEIVDYH